MPTYEEDATAEAKRSTCEAATARGNHSNAPGSSTGNHKTQQQHTRTPAAQEATAAARAGGVHIARRSPKVSHGL